MHIKCNIFTIWSNLSQTKNDNLRKKYDDGKCERKKKSEECDCVNFFFFWSTLESPKWMKQRVCEWCDD